MKVAVTKRDFGWQALLKKARQLSKQKPYVKVGVLGGTQAHRPGEAITNVELAIIHEFGAPTKNIPQRSFIRVPFHNKIGEYKLLLRNLVKGTLTQKGTDLRRALGLLGQRIAADFKKSAPGTPPPNAPSTLARKLAKTRPGSKGSPQTLVDTGRMVNSITYEVIDG